MNKMLAYWDCFAGLVPCTVIRIERSNSYFDDIVEPYCVIATITADRGPYRRGQQIAQSPRHIWPRDIARPKRGTYGQTYIVTSYNWEERCAAP